MRAPRLPRATLSDPRLVSVDVDVDAGVQWLPDSALAPPHLPGSSSSHAQASRQRRSRQTPTRPPLPPGGGGTSSAPTAPAAGVAPTSLERLEKQQQQQPPGKRQGDCVAQHPRGTTDGGHVSSGGGGGGLDGVHVESSVGNRSAAKLQEQDEGVGGGYDGSVATSVATARLPPSAVSPQLAAALAPRGGGDENTPRQTHLRRSAATKTTTTAAADPFFGSGEWAAGGFPDQPSPSATAGAPGGPVNIESPAAAAGGAATATAAASVTAGRFGMAAVELPDSPLSVCSAVTSVGGGGGREGVGGGGTGGRDSGVGGYWSVDGPGGRLVEESPSRAKERAARRSLMREADTLGEGVCCGFDREGGERPTAVGWMLVRFTRPLDLEQLLGLLDLAQDMYARSPCGDFAAPRV